MSFGRGPKTTSKTIFGAHRAFRVVLPIFVLGVPVFACNALTGASDLEPCSGVGCELEAGGDPIDGAAQRGDGSPNPFDPDVPGLPKFDGGTPFDPFDASNDAPAKDATVVCSTCDSGFCESTNGACSREDDCCKGLHCSAEGKCVSMCGSGSDAICFGGTACCLGYKCSVFECVPCGLADTACTSGGGGSGNGAGGCCSGVCNANKCVGSFLTK